ncbi:MAG TPA: ABC transporter substrate-binding protein [Acetobacteraceae bacterium]|jgi:branched-chain amino acid transport system substrate-binding protein|nr:ABC transporter substrate-binding protein [Acetobacteraceae bacterium]
MTRLIGRRSTLALGAAAGASGLARRACAQAPKEVEIAMLVPLSGPWARQGILEKMGAELAIEDVNSAGGIKALGGAKLKLLELDTQDSAEKAKDAAQRMIAQHPDLVGGFGCWLSTFTLAVTEVTERAQLPWLTLSYSDLITGRGYKYVFQSSPTADQQSQDMVPVIMALAEKASGKRPTKVGLIGDNTAASISFMKPIRDHVLKDEKLVPVVDQTYTPPLTDATTLVQPVRSARPDFVLLTSTNVPDDKLLLDKFSEFNLPPSKMPLIGNGGHWAVPELLKVAGADEVEGVLVGLANWPGKDAADISARFVKRTGEPWFGHDSIFAYAHVMILKEALERAGVADRVKVNEALHALDMTTGPALLFPGGHLQYDARGRRIGAKMVMVQWQNARPVTVYPPEVASAAAKWKA